MILALALATMTGSTAMKPPASVPSSCSVTTVERWNDATLSQYPFVRLQPTFAGITLEMQTTPIGAPDSAYAPIAPTGTTVVWHGTAESVAITGMQLDGTGQFNVVQQPLQNGWPLDFPNGGCWKLHVISGTEMGDLILWVAPPAVAP